MEGISGAWKEAAITLSAYLTEKFITVTSKEYLKNSKQN